MLAVILLLACVSAAPVFRQHFEADDDGTVSTTRFEPEDDGYTTTARFKLEDDGSIFAARFEADDDGYTTTARFKLEDDIFAARIWPDNNFCATVNCADLFRSDPEAPKPRLELNFIRSLICCC